ncbi:hypothetical protein Q5741_02210 [Paenibacillus sp. JX-17]|uniref:Antitermination protein NusB n=1 Tax=Paenibacillus lacisoli TaxID=3064525 RepID=A0ABT9C7J5_9BACL|nr:hypothetical protein [Paenibacillus sp. JX-17]MDO7905226.1 hypothetical protein [Paenibacillus sp. JX-17]
MAVYRERGLIVDTGSFSVGWGTLALINAGLAQGKNRSGLNWFLLSLLLGPLATFLIVVMGKMEEKED